MVTMSAMHVGHVGIARVVLYSVEASIHRGKVSRKETEIRSTIRRYDNSNVEYEFTAKCSY